MQSAVDYYRHMGGGFTTVDVLINVVMILAKMTNVLNVDIWNFIHFLVPGTLAYALTNNAWIGLGVVLVLSVIDLIVA